MLRWISIFLVGIMCLDLGVKSVMSLKTLLIFENLEGNQEESSDANENLKEIENPALVTQSPTNFTTRQNSEYLNSFQQSFLPNSACFMYITDIPPELL
ncbi:MAG: hypothetical protein IPH93_01380 [Saprospiraceae bacterium]|nr:hypothetical protein [Saprospiraceae bacterium]MBK7810159.1 hypothetical protein [Saprospiraceae bacterium]MBK9629763.1 hypothetical protein [Saprospiraceae bacterium]